MADRDIENASQEVPEIPETLEKVLLFALEEAKTTMAAGEEVVPFTVLVVKENLFIETAAPEDASAGYDTEDCFNFAQHTVAGARGAEAYAFCYDGYVETDDGDMDVLIAEGGVPGDEDGFAIGYLYSAKDGEAPVFESEPVYVGEAPNFMDQLKPADEYSDDEIDEKFLGDAEDEPACACGCGCAEAEEE